MSSQIITPLAERLIAVAEEAATAKGYVWPPSELSKLPALVIELPLIERTPVDEPEDHLGQKDWTITFPAIFYFELTQAPFSQQGAVDVVEQFITLIDNDPTLDNLCQEAKVVEAEVPEYVEDEARPVIRWPLRVQILKFV